MGDQQQLQSFYGPLSRTTRISRYQKKHSPTHHHDHHPIFITFFNLLQSMVSSLLKLRAWQSFYTTSLRVLFGLPLGLEPSTSYFIHFFTQSMSSFHNTCPYHRSLFCCDIKIISSIPSLSLNSLLGPLSFLSITHPSDHSHLCSLKCHLIFTACRNARIASAVLATAIPSVRPSVHHTPVLYQNDGT